MDAPKPNRTLRTIMIVVTLGAVGVGLVLNTTHTAAPLTYKSATLAALALLQGVAIFFHLRGQGRHTLGLAGLACSVAGGAAIVFFGADRSVPVPLIFLVPTLFVVAGRQKR